MKIFNKFICLMVLISLLVSCGVVTRTRYGNGLKLNVDLNPFRREAKAEKMTKLPMPGRKVANPRDQGRNPGSPVQELYADTVNSTSLNRSGGVVSVIREGVGIPVAAKRIQRLKSKSRKPLQADYSDVPVEPTVRLAAYLFYGGMIGSFIPYVNIVAGIAMLIGFILALVGLRNLRRSDYAFRGYGLAMSIVIVSIVSILLSIAFLLLILSLFVL